MGEQDQLQIWINHELSGLLTVSKHDTRKILSMFTAYEEDNECPLRSHWGGPERGSIVTINDPTIPDEACVISEYGELLTVREVKARSGAKRSDGMPTELFGYE